ncbi:MAG TPA: Rieske 2Fe-2S domain-containing protein [Stellaceae bacterium]|jgi:anthranilate 1,2-dioxygenase large subunit|nr:Rieske 2Fe-2S domain-containing protein [Stellaceae bacterium]
MLTSEIWPALDYSRVPYRLYHDAEAYEREQERIFRGPTWNFLGLEAEIANNGDFRAAYVGDTPVVVNRGANGAIHAFVNRCAHRGAMVRRELSGNATEHTCIYHQWCYGLDGGLKSIPFRRGIRGQGGMDPSFDMAAHGLRRLTVESINGALFGTFADDPEPLEDYLGAPVLAQLRRLFDRPVRILGYNRQRIRGNWKLYAENTRDNYHASLLHEFLVTFGLDRSTQVGGVKMDVRHRHNITWAEAESDTDDMAQEAYGGARVRSNYLSLKEPELVRFRRERADPLNIAITSVFPGAVFVQISNSLAVRQIRPRGVDEVEIFQTMLGYEDDPPDMMLHRLRQANLVGPAGLVSMEDGEAIEIAHRASKPDRDRSTVIELGGGGVISDRDYRVTDVPLRGFWSYYAELLGIEPAGAVR